MYSRSYNSQSNVKPQIPVESFGDSFSADAYLSQGFKEKGSEEKICQLCEGNSHTESCDKHQEQHLCKEEHEHKHKQECNSGCVFGNIKIDDLILIGLIIMFIKDGKNSNDYLIPILLAVVLLF